MGEREILAEAMPEQSQIRSKDLSIIISVLAFLLAISILVAVHEWGHFIVARSFGIKTLRFSIGFGKIIWHKITARGLEIAVSILPLGGYVKFLDEREGKVLPAERPHAFNRQTVGVRFCVVLAGPLFNFLLAFILFWLVFVIGVQEVKPLIGEVVPQSMAAKAGFLPGQNIVAVDTDKTSSWQDIRLAVYQRIGSEKPLTIWVQKAGEQSPHALYVDVSGIRLDEDNVDVLEDFGLFPFVLKIPAVVENVEAKSPAAAVGLQKGDRIESVGQEKINNWQDLLKAITNRGGQTVNLGFVRRGKNESLQITLGRHVDHQGEERGFLGVRAKAIQWPKSLFIQKRYGPMAAIPAAWTEFWQVCTLSTQLLYKMLTAQMGFSGLSGPIGIAHSAGSIARAGIAPYLEFLGLISIGLGIVNLLPIPVLDGGFLLYFLIEAIRKRPLSERSQLIGIKIGFSILVLVLLFASYNDIMRLLQ